MDCLFCKIAAGEIPSTQVYEDETVYAFRDINPQAPTHVLLIPKQHAADGMRGICAENSAVVAHIFEVIPQVAALCGLKDYRVVSNNGPEAGQTVDHLHFHLLGGRTLHEMG